MHHKAEQIVKTLFNENFHSLVFTSFRLSKDYEQSKDIVQNVFVKIWQNYDSIMHIKDLKSYLYKAVRNSTLNYLRDHKETEQNKIPIQTINLEQPVEDEIEMDKSDILNKVHHAVEKLPEKWRKAFILSKYEKLKYYEVAEKMNISDKTVEKYISKALMFIRTEMKHIIMLLIYLFFTKV